MTDEAPKDLVLVTLQVVVEADSLRDALTKVGIVPGTRHVRLDTELKLIFDAETKKVTRGWFVVRDDATGQVTRVFKKPIAGKAMRLEPKKGTPT